MGHEVNAPALSLVFRLERSHPADVATGDRDSTALINGSRVRGH